MDQTPSSLPGLLVEVKVDSDLINIITLLDVGLSWLFTGEPPEDDVAFLAFAAYAIARAEGRDDVTHEDLAELEAYTPAELQNRLILLLYSNFPQD